MSSVLEEFAYGNITPEADCFKKDSRHARAMELVCRNGEKLMDRLGPAEQDILKNLVRIQGEVNEMTAVRNFIYGFRLGLLMTAEAFIRKEDLYLNGDEA